MENASEIGTLADQASDETASRIVAGTRSAITRGSALALLLLAEWIPISVFMHTRRGGQSVARALVAFFFLYCALAFLKHRREIVPIVERLRSLRVSLGNIVAHVICMAVFLALSSGSARGSLPVLFVTAAWYASGFAAIVSAGLLFFPFAFWRDVFRMTRYILLVASGGGAIAWLLIKPAWSTWNNSGLQFISNTTFWLVEHALRLFVTVVVDRPERSIGSPRFSVSIGDACSGLEGAGLMLVFSVFWLILFRRECRFPRALLVVPAGVLLAFLLNVVRITLLILIGNAGAPAVALGGFHSQAGWIGFNLVALSYSFLIPRVAWLSAAGSVIPGTGTKPEPNPAVPFLLPFTFLLAAGMLSRAASSGFEWLYPLRIIAVVAGLWICRKSYADGALTWRPGWQSLAGGALAFLLWLSLDHPAADSGIGASLALLSPPARDAWVACRILGAVITVPVAEELAFRGYLLRRLTGRDWQSLSFRRFSWPALLLSSLAFGLLHGDRWVAGSLAGLIYAGLMLRSGRFGDAVIAHSFTNLLLALWVIHTGSWYLW